MRLGGQVAVVTGASRGIGRAIALALAHEGVRVAVNYARSRGPGEALVAEILAAGGQAVAVRADVSQAAEVDRLSARQTPWEPPRGGRPSRRARPGSRPAVTPWMGLWSPTPRAERARPAWLPALAARHRATREPELARTVAPGAAPGASMP